MVIEIIFSEEERDILNIKQAQIDNEYLIGDFTRNHLYIEIENTEDAINVYKKLRNVVYNNFNKLLSTN